MRQSLSSSNSNFGDSFREWNWDLAERNSSMSPNRWLYNGNERETGLGVNMYDGTMLS